MPTPEKQNAASSIPSRLAHPVVISLLLMVLTMAVFWPVKHCDFINYDDPEYFFENQHVLGGLTGGNIRWAFTNIESSNWHPVTWLSLMLDAELAGNNPAVPHLTNLLFHAGSVVLLFFLLRQLTDRLWPGAVAAALFAIHPLRVESVAWISERKDVLSVFFGLLALIFYARHVEGLKIQGSKGQKYYLLSLGMFALGLMSKPLVVTLPFVMLLLDYWPLQRLTIDNWRRAIGRLVAEKIPFFVLCAAGCAMTFFAQQKTHAVGTMARYPMSMRMENTVVSYVSYLEKTFWPFSLATPYPHPGWWPAPTVVLSVLLLVFVTGAVIYFAKRFPYAAVGWFWFVGTLVPMIGLVQVGGAAMADRYSYLSGIGIFIALAWGGAAIFKKSKMLRLPMIILIVLVLAGLSLRTRDQLRLWQNDFVLFTHANVVTKNNYVALVELGRWHSRQGQMSETLDCYYVALRMDPDDPSVLYDIGNSFAKLGNWDEAIRDYRHALQFAPDSPDILNNLGLALAQKNQMAEAQTNFEAALKIDPNLPGAHNNLATIFFRQGNYEEAARHFNLALEQTPDNPQLLANLGETLLRQGKTDLAVKCYQRAAQLQPDNEKFRQRLQAIQQRSN